MRSRRDHRRGATLAAAALSASLGFAASAIAIEPTLRAGLPPAGAPVLVAQNAPAKVSYSKDQANRGEDTYKKQCVECHGEDLRGGLLGGPPLRGGMFDMHFGGAPASALFVYMSTQMPPESPGRFSDAVYAEIMAYVLSRNGYDDGAPLPTNAAALDKLVLEK